MSSPPTSRKRVAWSSSCSRNAHDKNVLVRRAQSRINQATLEIEPGIEEMRAVKDGLPVPSWAREESVGGVIRKCLRLEAGCVRQEPSASNLQPPTSDLQRPRLPLNLDLNLSLRSQGGFTLVEVLLAVSLVALMATLVFGSLYVTTSAIDVARANSATEQIVRSTLRVMSEELSVSRESTNAPWMGINGLFDGRPADSVAFLTMGQFRGADSAKDTELVRIVYTREGDVLLRFVRRNLYGLTDETVERVELARKVKGFNVRYFDGRANLWMDEWTSAMTGAPKALLLELTLLQENEELQTIRQWVTVGAP